jgi:hypothetical protein
LKEQSKKTKKLEHELSSLRQQHEVASSSDGAVQC